MELELSKREIEVILELMEYGSTFLASHQWAEEPVKEGKERVNINDLEEKLKRAITKCKEVNKMGEEDERMKHLNCAYKLRQKIMKKVETALDNNNIDGALDLARLLALISI